MDLANEEIYIRWMNNDAETVDEVTRCNDRIYKYDLPFRRYDSD